MPEMSKEEFEAEQHKLNEQLLEHFWDGVRAGKTESQLHADFDAEKEKGEQKLLRKFWHRDTQALREKEVDKTEKEANKGCLTPGRGIAGMAALLLLVAAFLAAQNALDQENRCDSVGVRRDGLVLAACQKPADAAASSTDEASASGSDTGSSSSSGGTAGGGTASIAPPDASALPPGAILFQGQTRDNIGPIAQDGLNRFVSLNAPGVTTDRTSVAIIWDKGAGTVVSFGSNLHTGTNKGRYGFALFRNAPATPPTTSPSGEADSQYRAGCAIEVGQTSCKSDTKGAPIVNGDSVTIIIGEAGTGVGDYSADWWFVFQPD